MPERAHVYLTPGAQKSLEEAERQGKQVRISSDRPRKAPPTVQSPPTSQGGAASDSAAGAPKGQAHPQKKPARQEPLTLKEAIIEEIRDRIKAARLSIQLNSEDIIKGVVIGAFLVLFALLQTTFFVRFAPFGAIPDLMLVFVIAIGVCEGERWGSIVGLCAAFVIQALGADSVTPEILSIIYLPAGCASGLLSKYYLRHTMAVNASYIAVFALIRALATLACAAFSVKATFGEMVLRIAIPEYFSTLIISPVPFLLIWFSLKPFHKTRAERTDSRTEL